ncbi:MAG: hypothetical protein Q7S16_05605 [bacterium]|nr:hypothetical protein [bacterium]
MESKNRLQLARVADFSKPETYTARVGQTGRLLSPRYLEGKWIEVEENPLLSFCVIGENVTQEKEERRIAILNPQGYVFHWQWKEVSLDFSDRYAPRIYLKRMVGGHSPLERIRLALAHVTLCVVEGVPVYDGLFLGGKEVIVDYDW